MNIGELKAAIAGLPDSTVVTIQVMEPESYDRNGVPSPYWDSTYHDDFQFDHEPEANTLFLMVETG